jgi:hypothetical protein
MLPACPNSNGNTTRKTSNVFGGQHKVENQKSRAMIPLKAMPSARFKNAFFKTDFFHSLRELIGYPWHEPHWKPSDPKGKVSPGAQAVIADARSYALLAMESLKHLPDEDSSAIAKNYTCGK